MEILPIARKLNSYGFKKLADKLVTRKYGAQIGKTSKTGGRAFCGKNETVNSFIYFGRGIGAIDKCVPEKVITAIDKDYNLVGQTVIRRMHKVPGNYLSYDYTQIERLLLPKANDPAKKCCLDITGFYGKNIKSQPGSPVESKHYRNRKAIEPEVKYWYNKPGEKYRVGDEIQDSFRYSYYPMDKSGNIVNRYCDIGYKNGGETFYNKINKMIDNWYEHHRVIRQENI